MTIVSQTEARIVYFYILKKYIMNFNFIEH